MDIEKKPLPKLNSPVSVLMRPPSPTTLRLPAVIVPAALTSPTIMPCAVIKPFSAVIRPPPTSMLPACSEPGPSSCGSRPRFRLLCGVLPVRSLPRSNVSFCSRSLCKFGSCCASRIYFIFILSFALAVAQPAMKRNSFSQFLPMLINNQHPAP